jgi:hypothetical protein
MLTFADVSDVVSSGTAVVKPRGGAATKTLTNKMIGKGLCMMRHSTPPAMAFGV